MEYLAKHLVLDEILDFEMHFRLVQITIQSFLKYKRITSVANMYEDICNLPESKLCIWQLADLMRIPNVECNRCIYRR